MTSFFAMGGFGGYIWASYAICFILLCWLGVSSWQWAKTVEKQLADLNHDNPTD